MNLSNFKISSFIFFKGKTHYDKKMLIDSSDRQETRIAIIENKKIIDYESEKSDNNRTKGNIYLAKIIRVEPLFRQHL